MIDFLRAEAPEVGMLTSGMLREMFHQVLPSDEIAASAVELGFVERDRKLDVGCFVRALVLAGGTPGAGLQADALHAYLDMKVPDISRAAFYKRFGPGLEALSIGTECPLRYHFSPGKEHDSRHLEIDESWRVHRLLADLGYASLARLRACMEHEVAFVIRLEENWKPKVDHVARGTVKKTFFAGADFDALVEDDVLVIEDKARDCDVRVGPEGRQIALRMVPPLAPMAAAKVFDRKADLIVDAMDSDDRGDQKGVLYF